MPDLMTPAHARNMRVLGYTDQGGGRADGTQVMVNRGYAYVGHLFSKGFSIVDVRNPKEPRPVSFVAAPPNSWTPHLQHHEDLLLVVNEKDGFGSPDLVERNGKRDWSAGLAVYDVGRPEAPRQIGFMPVEGNGLHRCWYAGGRWAYASALLNGYSDYIMITIDMADPRHPRVAGRFALPGMQVAPGERPAQARDVLRCHHPIIDGDIAYCAWFDANLVVVDVADRASPKLLAHKTWTPPYGGHTHNALPLPKRDLLVVVDQASKPNHEDGEKPIWIFDNRVKANPVSIATMPEPADSDYCKVPGNFGPNNLYENRAAGLVSEELIFATFQNAGLRVFDIRDKFRPVETAAFVPPGPFAMVDPRPGQPRAIRTCDVFVDKNGICYCTDFNAGLYIVEYQG